MRIAPLLLKVLFAGCALASATLAAQAQVSKEIVEATAGDWLLAPEDGRPGCRVQLRTNEAIGGYELRPSPSCMGLRTMMVAVVAWRFDEANSGIAFTGPQRETIVSFAEKEDGTYASDGDPGEVLLLVKAPAGVTAVPNAKNIFGTWSVLKAGGGALCRITFAEDPPPGGEESYALKLDEACDASLTKLKLASWRIEGLNLMLYGTDGESLSFAPSDTGTFITDATPPLMLVRQKRD
jgi:hypothetical protein